MKDAREILKEMIGEILAMREGIYVEENVDYAVKQLRELVKAIDNPYPEKVFTKISDDEWKKIDNLLESKMGFRLDRVGGNLYREGFEVFRADMLKELEAS